MIKDPNNKKAVMAAAIKAAKEAQTSGAGHQDMLIAAQNAIKQILLTYKPTGSVR